MYVVKKIAGEFEWTTIRPLLWMTYCALYGKGRNKKFSVLL